MDVLRPHLERLREICRTYGVRRLELFGSAGTGGFDPETSDFDFFVDFGEQPPTGSFRRYMGLKMDLEALLGRPVDLVEPRSITNPYFARAARRREEVYAA